MNQLGYERLKKVLIRNLIMYAKINDLESIVVWMNGYVCDEMKDNFESESKYIYNETLKNLYIPCMERSGPYPEWLIS